MVKVGDKVRVTSNKYPTACPRGTICAVFEAGVDGCIGTTIDGGDMVDWFFAKGEYELIVTEEEPEYNYAAQAAKYGIEITIELVNGNVVTFDGSK